MGVFAIRRIPKGINPLEVPIPTKLVALTLADVRPLPPGIRQMIRQYAANQDGRYILPTLGFNLPELEYFVNHSPKPNMIFDDEAGCYRTGRIIARGEELTGDYKRFAPRMPGIK